MGSPCINFQQIKKFIDSGLLLSDRKGTLIHGDRVLATFVTTISGCKITMGIV